MRRLIIGDLVAEMLGGFLSNLAGRRLDFLVPLFESVQIIEELFILL
jgi:hypothetical protein